MNEEFREAADAVFDGLLARIGESNPQPRLGPTRRAVELLGDPHRSYPIIHITGTNGKTSTSRMIESLLRAHGLRTGLMTSPHLQRFTERILIDGVPITDEAVVHNWNDIEPYIAMVDAELLDAGEPELSYFEALTVLAFASFADAPVDVVVLEVGMGGEWDSTNVADALVAVFAPIALDHQSRLGNTIAEIARTKAGIIKPASIVVSAAQHPDAEVELRRAAQLTESEFNIEGDAFTLVDTTVAVGGQMISVNGRAGEYREIFLPIYGDHQAHNATLAIAAVESFLGNGSQPLVGDVLTEGMAEATSPGRLQLIGTDPSVIVDAAHNPHGAASLAAALQRYFHFDEITFVVGVLADKDAKSMMEALAPLATRFHVTQSASDRSIDAFELSEIVGAASHVEQTFAFDHPKEALDLARAWAQESPRRAVVVTGSITLVAEAMAIAEAEKWKNT